MVTRDLENKDFLRANVDYIELDTISENIFLFKTFSTLKSKSSISSADSNMFDQKNSWLAM